MSCLAGAKARIGPPVPVLSPKSYRRLSCQRSIKGKNKQMLKKVAGFSPANRIGTLKEIADVVQFLSGEGSRWVSGQIWRTDGGMA